MLLTTDIGNSSVILTFFSPDAGICRRIRLGSDPARTQDEYAALIHSSLNLSGIDLSAVTGAIVSSVVPSLTYPVTEAIRIVFPGLEKVMLAGPGMRTGFVIKTDNPSEVGTDIVANTAYAVKAFHMPLLIADFGTMTVLTLVSGKCEMLGNVILPGIGTMFRSMSDYSALLPELPAAAENPGKVPLYGTNTPDSIRSGILRGHAFAVDSYIRNFEKDMGEKLCTVATGGYASYVTALCQHSFTVDPDLTAKGLYTLYNMPAKPNKATRS